MAPRGRKEGSAASLEEAALQRPKKNRCPRKEGEAAAAGKKEKGGDKGKEREGRVCQKSRANAEKLRKGSVEGETS